MLTLPPPKLRIANRLWLPEATQAILWDMDGVLVDSLSLCLTVSNRLLAERFGEHVRLTDAFIRSVFAYDVPEFWRLILLHVAETYPIPDAPAAQPALQALYKQARDESVFPLNPGIPEILQDAQQRRLPMAVVSNNPTEDVKAALRHSGILEFFTAVIGNDIEHFEKKPAPDTYLYAAKTLGVAAKHCVVVEDSLIGVEAGRRAGCHTLGVASGGTDRTVLAASGWPAQTYARFDENALVMQFGDVRDKKIVTPNDFVSHMVEHIAWRLCVSIRLAWNNDDWLELGRMLGGAIRGFAVQQSSAAALGMIDDGSAEVCIDLQASTPGLTLDGIDTLDLDWFLGLRCEQLADGEPLVQLMHGLADGLAAHLRVDVCSVQDPHHTWEGVFRSIGIALNRLFTPRHPSEPPFDDAVTEQAGTGELQVRLKSLHKSQVFRGTAESHVVVTVDFSRQMPNRFVFNVADSIDVDELPELLELLAEQAGFTLQVEYQATVLNSSHVVLEDTALVLGRALLEILTLRMAQWGVDGAGGSIHAQADIAARSIHVGVSVEGRKFWRFVAFGESDDALRKRLLIGQTIGKRLRSEDLDDFLDGLSGGLACSIIVHVHRLTDADSDWRCLFAGLGMALREAFKPNPYRKGVPPGVKATLS